MSNHTVVCIPGDGIGPEVMAATRRVVDATGVKISWIEASAGKSVLEKGGADALPKETLTLIREHKVALKGPTETPIGEGHQSANVRLRKELDLYAAVRPVQSVAGIRTRFEGVNLVVIRENTEGLYCGEENILPDGTATSLKRATPHACMRIVRFAFEYARKHKREKVTLFHKANILKATDGMMLRLCRDVSAKEYADIKFQELIIDAGCMKLVQDPTQFDVLVMENLYGDIVSDLCAGFVGGLGVVGGANIGESSAVFEAVHGSALDIAGKGHANPLALIMSACMMLDHLDEGEVAAKIRKACREILIHGVRTRDLRGTTSTELFAEHVVSVLR